MPVDSAYDQAEHSAAADPAGRDSEGRFRRGYSGNPAGRPRGSRNRATLMAEAILDGDAEAMSRKIVELAISGDPIALRFCLSRIVAPRRDRGVEVELPPVAHAADLAPAMTAVADAAAAGEISPREGADFAKMIDTVIRAVDLGEFERRLRELEQSYADLDQPA